MNVIEELTEIFRRFPGIGPRQAERFVYHLLRQPKANLSRLSSLIPSLADNVRNCNECKRFFISEHANLNCKICLDKNRDRKRLMIVARDSDFTSVEKSNNFDGVYFILGGLIPILEKDHQKFIRAKELKDGLKNRIEKDSLEEIILALNANPDGENTEKFLKQDLSDLDIKISVLGRGLSTGTELEYSDSETIRNALENRK